MIKLSTIFKFLFFQADSIRAIANSRTATWVGFLFVLSAGFAREYDGEYLVREPWHLAIPVAASMLACFVMVCLVYIMALYGNRKRVSFWKTYTSFLNVYWMTAPMAWLYAIPFERFMSPGDATRANLILLAFVAAWRVGLMIRCVEVLCQTNRWAAIGVVMLFSDGLVLLALFLVPSPVFMIMGGVRLSESEDIILGIRVTLFFLGFGSLLPWIIWYVGACHKHSRWRWFTLGAEPNSTEDMIDSQAVEPESFQAIASDNEFSETAATTGATRSVWGLVAASLLIWIPILPFTQTEQRLRWLGDRAIRSHDWPAFAQLSRDHELAEFPNHWDAPPRIGYGERDPKIEQVIIGLNSANADAWAMSIYGEKLELQTSDPHSLNMIFHDIDEEELKILVDAVIASPNSKAIASNVVDATRYMIESETNEQKKDLLKQLQAIANESGEVGSESDSDTP